MEVTTMVRRSLVSLVMLVGCGAETAATIDEPDAGSDGGADELSKIAFVPTAIHDERGDEITFRADGVPAHAHSGPTIELGNDGCPDVFKYAYLMDPASGAEDAPNPLRWQLAVSGTGRVEYRVRRADGSELGWTPLEADVAGNYQMTLYRSELAELGTTEAMYFIDARIGDAVASSCFVNHPMAPPVQVVGPTAAHRGDAIVGWSFAANSPVSGLFGTTAHPSLLEVQLVHATAEPLAIEVALPPPAVTWSKTVVTDWVLIENRPTSIDCGVTCAGNSPTCFPEPAAEAACKTGAPPEISDPTTTGTLATGSWLASALDAATGLPVAACSIDPSGTRAACQLPARAAGTPPQRIAIVLAHRANTELRPATSGRVGEFSLLGQVFTGLDPAVAESTERCTQLVASTANSDGEVFHTCVRVNRFVKLVALDRLTLVVAPPAVHLASSTGGAFVPVAYLPDGVATGTGFTWDSGDDDLPGPQH
jgi:hypothetical protein